MASAETSHAPVVPLSTRDVGVQTREDLAQELDVARMQLQRQVRGTAGLAPLLL